MVDGKHVRLVEATLRDVIALGVYLVLQFTLEAEDMATVKRATRAPEAVQLADALLKALGYSLGESR